MTKAVFGPRSVSLKIARFLSANNVNPDQTPYYVTSDLGLHCLPTTLSRVSR